MSIRIMDSIITYSLATHNTLGIDVSCEHLIKTTDELQLIDTCLDAANKKRPLLAIGGGSNIVLTDSFKGIVVLIATKGINVVEDQDCFHLSVAAGENWHELVQFCLTHNMPGLENLALIPGSVGAAPIQNIGAYGADFSQFCEWVEYLDLTTGERVRLDAEQCLFDYRDSIFKSTLKDKAVILNVGLRLEKEWRPNLSYGPLQQLSATTLTPTMIFDCICATRSSKLPDPAALGNVGSFFKNPIVSSEHFTQLQQEYPAIVGYPVNVDKVKLAAGWLIENAGLKGHAIGGAAIHLKQALVIVNVGKATGADVCTLAREVIQRVNQIYSVYLEVEPRIIGAVGERELNDA
ncbi:UDP-N-acetylmuramate dehydrogenase [Shewanella algidipiscicola]|uniref:UDP-N-acetylmuramate dehydrogenase n=1 Tax=Shewanella algidipiscicola TaxID=614070 RepID=UPI001EF4A374|nr:UDP-N-acetylmuramate dehydrogenase [Shewanella algidipiscicola]